MGGRGPAPKPPEKRVRRNKDSIAATFIEFVPCPQPPLPAEIPWPDRTIEFWEKWGRSPLARLFTEVDWEELMATALLHADLWSGNLDRAQELRLRMAQFGASLEARARLRIQMSEADASDGGQPVGVGSAPSYSKVSLTQVSPDVPKRVASKAAAKLREIEAPLVEGRVSDFIDVEVLDAVQAAD